MNDNITKLPTKPRLATTGDNFSPADAETLARLGLDPSAWPHNGGYAKKLCDLRGRVQAMTVALDSLARHCMEIDRELTALLGEDTEPGDEPA